MISEGSHYEVRFHNNVHLGEFICDVDGYWKFFPALGGGYWEGYVLRAIADKEEELNREWDQIIQNDPRIGDNKNNDN